MSFELHHGDCLDVMATLPDASIDCVLTDPPYAIPTIVAANRHTTRNVGDLSLIEATFRGLFSEFDRLLRPSGRFFVFCDGTSYPVLFRAAYGRFSTALLVWNKGRIGMGREFRKSHELILHCWKPETPVYTDGIGRADILTAKPLSTNRVHPAEKPIELLEQLLAVAGQDVLDPFMGSGAAGVASLRTKRRFTGVEIDDRYFEIAKNRIEGVRKNEPLFAEAA